MKKEEFRKLRDNLAKLQAEQKKKQSQQSRAEIISEATCRREGESSWIRTKQITKFVKSWLEKFKTFFRKLVFISQND